MGGLAFRAHNAEYMRKYRIKQRESTLSKKRKTPASELAHRDPVIEQQIEEEDGDYTEESDNEVDDSECTELNENIQTEYMIYKHPFTMTIYGTTGSGKTFWTLKLLKNKEQMIQPNIKKIYWFYGSNGAVDEVKKEGIDNVEFIKGLPTDSWVQKQKRDENKLVIIDDQMNDFKSGVVGNLFTKYSHHENMSVIVMLQNMFPKAADMRDVNLNAKYQVVFMQPDRRQMRILSSGLLDYPSAIQDILEEKKRNGDFYAYLVIDHDPCTPLELRLRSSVFPDDKYREAYLIDEPAA